MKVRDIERSQIASSVSKKESLKASPQGVHNMQIRGVDPLLLRRGGIGECEVDCPQAEGSSRGQRSIVNRFLTIDSRR